jgi:micrococcal nuclease
MPRYRRSYAAQLVGIVILAALLIARWQGWLDEPRAPRLPTATDRWQGGEYEIERVVDGDTLLLRNHQRVRLQGIDCPEIPHENHPETDAWAPEAVSFTQEFIRDAHHRVRLEADGEPRDHFDRWLAFVWDGDRLLNEELVRAGLARARLRYDYSQKKKDLLRAAQLDAQRAGRGIWADAN